MNKKHVVRVVWVLLTLVIVLGLISFFELGSVYNEMKSVFHSQESLEEYIEGYGVWAPIVFLAIQTVQVILSPIPGNVTAMAGGALFGAAKGFLLSGLGVLIGSVIAFFLARIFGQPLVIKIVGQSVFDKYSKVFSGKYTFALFIIFLIPFFPDDALCFLAGLSSMPFFLFLALVIVGRMPGMLVASLAGSGTFTLSLLQWAIIAVISLVIIFLVGKYSREIEEFFYKKLKLDKKGGK